MSGAEIDGRIKKLVVGDRNKIVVDFTHRALLKWMGKDSYEFGDITKTYSEKKAPAQERNASNLSGEALKLFSSKSEENLVQIFWKNGTRNFWVGQETFGK